MSITLQELAVRIGARLEGDGSTTIVGCASIATAGPDEVAFLSNAKYTRFLRDSRAAAVIVGEHIEPVEGVRYLIAKDPYFAFREAMIALHGFRQHPPPPDTAPIPGGRHPLISPKAVIHPGAIIGEDTIIHPFVTIENGARIGERCVLYPGTYIGPDATLGDECVLYPNVTVYDRCILGDRVTLHASTVIGQDGFGYATHQGAHHKIPQHGVVVLEDDVELGAGCAIERAAMGETRIGAGTKFADLISIGHGTTVGKHCLFVSLVGVSGSVEVGNYVVLGGQVGVTGHLKIGDGVQAAGKAAIVHNVPPGQKVGGVPAVEINTAKRNALISTDLVGLLQRIKQLEARLKELEGDS